MAFHSLTVLALILLRVLCVCVSALTCTMYVYYVHAWGSQRPEEELRSPGASATGWALGTQLRSSEIASTLIH